MQKIQLEKSSSPLQLIMIKKQHGKDKK